MVPVLVVCLHGVASTLRGWRTRLLDAEAGWPLAPSALIALSSSYQLFFRRIGFRMLASYLILSLSLDSFPLILPSLRPLLFYISWPLPLPPAPRSYSNLFTTRARLLPRPLPLSAARSLGPLDLVPLVVAFVLYLHRPLLDELVKLHDYAMAPHLHGALAGHRAPGSNVYCNTLHHKLYVRSRLVRLKVMAEGYGWRLWLKVTAEGYGWRLWLKVMAEGYGWRLWLKVMAEGYSESASTYFSNNLIVAKSSVVGVVF